MIAHITGQDAVTFAALASLPFAVSILWKRHKANAYWRSISSIAQQVNHETEYALSRERHPAGKKFQRN